jgi:crotonobetainyl-CoA:carnitine CoA-transferase CaiB-like acyl-CoA transferase
MQGVVPKFLDTPGEVRHAGRALGADNRAVYVEGMGMSEERFMQLQSRGII